MNKIILYMFITLDGFIAGPNGEFDDYEPSVEEMQFANGLFGAASGIIFGRKTYEGFVSYWDTLDVADAATSAVDAEFATIFRKMNRIVVSRTLTHVEGRDTLITQNLFETLSKLKQQAAGHLLLICGPTLLATLIEHKLVDECLLWVKPKAIGRGMALFGEIKDLLQLKPSSVRVFESGCVLQHYEIDTRM